MKFDTMVLIAKGWFVASAAAAQVLAGGISQLPKEITMIGHIPLPVVGLWCNVYSAFAVSTIGFLSSSFSDFVSKRTNGGPSSSQTDFFGKNLPVNPLPPVAQPPKP